jgi:hypothetical protein
LGRCGFSFLPCLYGGNELLAVWVAGFSFLP